MKTNKLMMAMAVMAAVSTTSCTNEEDLAVNNTGNDNAVTFGAYIGTAPASRAGDTDLQTFHDLGFGVFAYYTGQAAYGESALPNFMYNQRVLGDENDNWTYDPIKYWPNNTGDKVTFFAYGPYVDHANLNALGSNIYAMSANNAAGDPTISFRMATAVADQVDLVYAEGVKDQTKPAYDAKVNLKFKHALSRIGFSWTAVVDEYPVNALGKDTKITIKKIEFNSTDLTTDGTLNLATGVWTPNGDASNLKYTLEEADFKTGENVIVSKDGADLLPIPTNKLNSDDKYMMIIPSKSTASTITVTYDVETLDPNVDGGKVTVTNKITMPVSLDFAAGKYYNIVLKVGLTSVKFEPEVADWDTAENSTEVIF